MAAVFGTSSSAAFLTLALAAGVAFAPAPVAGADGTTAAPRVAAPDAAPPDAAPPDAAPPGASGTTLLRTTLLVADVERAAAFYALLGFVVENTMGGPRDPAATKFPLNAPATRSRLLILASPSGGGKLGLLQFDAPAPAPTRAPRERIGVGDSVLVLDVADAQALHDVLRAAGANIVAPLQTYRSRRTDAQGRPLQGRVFHVFDPDGNLVELLEAPQPVG